MIKPLHTRFRMSASGPLHVGHFLLASLSREAARTTGGTFLVRAEALKCIHEFGREMNHRKWWDANFEELRSVGIVPTAPEVLNATEDLNAGMGWEVMEERALQEFYWRKVGLEAMIGSWPPPIPPHEMEERDKALRGWRSTTFGNYEFGGLHPYVMFATCVSDIARRRNCIIHGSDHKGEDQLTGFFGQLIAREMFGLDGWDDGDKYVPKHWFTPKIMRSGTTLSPDTPAYDHHIAGEPWPISSSYADLAAGFRIKDIAKSGVDPHIALRFLLRVMFGSDENADRALDSWHGDVEWHVDTDLGDPRTYGADRKPSIQHGPKSIFANAVRDPVIDDDEWFDLLGIDPEEAT